MEIFSKRLRKLRKEKGITLEKMARDLQTTKSTLSRYENNKTEPKVNLLKEIAEYLDTTIDYLMGKTDNKTSYEINNNSLSNKLNTLINELGIEYIEVIDHAKEKGYKPKDIKKIIDTFEDLKPLLKDKKNNK